MKILALTLMTITNLLIYPAYGKQSCGKALEAIPKFKSSKQMFNEIFEFKQEYFHCMDGGIAEGIAAVVVDSLDKNWSQLSEIEKLNKRDASFKKFILSNIAPNVTAQEAEVSSIISHAKKSCPKNMRDFCKDLIQSCESSLKPD